MFYDLIDSDDQEQTVYPFLISSFCSSKPFQTLLTKRNHTSTHTTPPPTSNPVSGVHTDTSLVYLKNLKPKTGSCEPRTGVSTSGLPARVSTSGPSLLDRRSSVNFFFLLDLLFLFFCFRGRLRRSDGPRPLLRDCPHP